MTTYIGTEPLRNFLAQYGVKGMRWGVRKKRGLDVPKGAAQPVTVITKPGKRVKATGGQNRPPSEDAKRTAALKQKARASTIDSLSNNELQDLLKRLQLEQSYAKMNPPHQGAHRYTDVAIVEAT